VSEREPFLTRWSRRKRDAANPALTGDAASREAPAPAGQEDTPTAAKPPAARASDAIPTVDLSKLPAIDSIAASTDIRPFLAPGVPAELRRAALRRAWQVDPAIRDYVGLAENQWDFTQPDGVPGFGLLHDSQQVQELVAQVMGERPAGAGEPADPEAPQPNAGPIPAPAPANALPPGQGAAEASDTHAPSAASAPASAAAPSAAMPAATPAQDQEVAACSRNEDGDRSLHRTHGGALPS